MKNAKIPMTITGITTLTAITAPETPPLVCVDVAFVGLGLLMTCGGIEVLKRSRRLVDRC